MASLLSSTASTFLQDSKPIKFPLYSSTNPYKKNSIKCNAFLNDISETVLNTSLHLEQSLLESPAFQQFQELPEFQRWSLLVFGGVSWIYLTARPGVLIGAIDSYIFAPLQLGFDTLIGRRSLKRSNFLVGDRLGEGSFGVVYSGVVVPKNASVDESIQSKGSRKSRQIDDRFKEKVILKKVDSLANCLIHQLHCYLNS